jgi:hypothetical protein
MVRVNLSVYSVKIKEKRSRNSLTRIDNLFASGTPFSEILEDTIKKYSKSKLKPYLDKDNQKAICFINSNDDLVPKEDSRLKVKKITLYYGLYGRIQEVLNTRTGAVDETLGEDMSPVMEYAVTFVEDTQVKSHAYLIVQSYSQLGYKSTLERVLSEEIHKSFPKCTLKIEPVVSPELIKKIEEEGKVMSVIFSANTFPRDSADAKRLLNSMQIKENNAKSVELTILGTKDKTLIPKTGISTFVEKARAVIKNGDATAFYSVAKIVPTNIRAQIALDNRSLTMSVNKEELEINEVFELKESSAIQNGRINEEYIFKKSIESILTIVNKYKDLFGECRVD